MPDEEIDAIMENGEWNPDAIEPADDPSQTNLTESDSWVIVADSIKGKGNYTGTDSGSMYLPMSRIALRDSNGIIPESMLPAYIDEIMFGSLATSASTTTFAVDEQGGTERVYESPTPAEGHYLPPTNAIFYDTGSQVQYRWIASQRDEPELHGFTAIPNSKTIVTEYGIDLTRDETSTTINAKKADYYLSTTASSALAVNNTASNLPLASGSGSTLTATIASNRLTSIGGLSDNVRYAVNLQIECTPTALSPNIIDVSVKFGSNPAIKKQMDMSGPMTSSVTVLEYSCDFTNGSSSPTMAVTISSEEAISVKTTRFSIYELL